MTDEIPFDKLIQAIDSPTISQNSQSIMQMLKEAHVFVSEVNKISQTLDQTLSLVQKYGIPVDRLVAGVAKKAGIDLYTPLEKDTSVSSNARSPLHQNVFDRLNLLSENQLMTFLGEVENMEKQKKLIGQGQGQNEGRSSAKQH